TVRSILQRDVDHRISQLLTQETGEFANFVPQGVDPDTGGRFDTADRLLRIYLQRQYADPDEELLGLTGPAGDRPDVIRQRRDLPPDTALWQDTASLTR
ncbi:two-component sensor histidine kinase, partial [Streptomyces sp. SID7982]|nr:two-component sensor histidine kinase [Streptomyces sp. SID7982]